MQKYIICFEKKTITNKNVLCNDTKKKVKANYIELYEITFANMNILSLTIIFYFVKSDLPQTKKLRVLIVKEDKSTIITQINLQ